MHNILASIHHSLRPIIQDQYMTGTFALLHYYTSTYPELGSQSTTSHLHGTYRQKKKKEQLPSVCN
uniref:Uncharacterized protein n=1 Tax=Anguilla anguilla TaxID=7936 RepID=A0A0E9WQ50_ANGAN